MILLNDQLPKETAELVSKDEAAELIKKLEIELGRSAILGCGLAAPQIGINKAAAIVRLKNPVNDPSRPILAINLVNPVLLEGFDLIQFVEGCLSFPGKSVKTVRFNEVIVEIDDDYEYYAEHLNANRYSREPRDISLFNGKRRKIHLGQEECDDYTSQLICVAAQHEIAHLVGLTFLSFAPKTIGRNEPCPCKSGIKNKKCHSYEIYNESLEKLFRPQYRQGEQ